MTQNKDNTPLIGAPDGNTKVSAASNKPATAAAPDRPTTSKHVPNGTQQTVRARTVYEITLLSHITVLIPCRK